MSEQDIELISNLFEKIGEVNKKETNSSKNIKELIKKNNDLSEQVLLFKKLLSNLYYELKKQKEKIFETETIKDILSVNNKKVSSLIDVISKTKNKPQSINTSKEFLSNLKMYYNLQCQKAISQTRKDSIKKIVNLITNLQHNIDLWNNKLLFIGTNQQLINLKINNKFDEFEPTNKVDEKSLTEALNYFENFKISEQEKNISEILNKKIIDIKVRQKLTPNLMFEIIKIQLYNLIKKEILDVRIINKFNEFIYLLLEIGGNQTLIIEQLSNIGSTRIKNLQELLTEGDSKEKEKLFETLKKG